MVINTTNTTPLFLNILFRILPCRGVACYARNSVRGRVPPSFTSFVVLITIAHLWCELRV